MKIIFCLLLFYSLVQLLHFFIGATVTDLKSHVTHDWYSDEREKRVNHHLIIFGKSVAAFLLAGWLVSKFGL